VGCLLENLSNKEVGINCVLAKYRVRRRAEGTYPAPRASAASWRSLMPMISAAGHHVIFFAKARKITSRAFIARSTAAFE
jgi:hypothetical protein